MKATIKLSMLAFYWTVFLLPVNGSSISSNRQTTNLEAPLPGNSISEENQTTSQNLQSKISPKRINAIPSALDQSRVCAGQAKTNIMPTISSAQDIHLPVKKESSDIPLTLKIKYEKLVWYIHEAPAHIDFPTLSKDFTTSPVPGKNERTFKCIFSGGTILSGKFTEPGHEIIDIHLKHQTCGIELWVVGAWIASRFYSYGAVMDDLGSEANYSPYHAAWVPNGKGAMVLGLIPNPLPADAFLAIHGSAGPEYWLQAGRDRGITLTIKPVKGME